MRAFAVLALVASAAATTTPFGPSLLTLTPFNGDSSKKGLLGLLGLLGLIPLCLLLLLSCLCCLCFLRRKKTAAAVPFATFDPCPPAVAAAPIPVTQHVDLVPVAHHHIDVIPDHHVDLIPDMHHGHHVDVIPDMHHGHHF